MVTLSYEEMKLVSEMVWLGIKNGNTVEPEAFSPTPAQYKVLCRLANELEKGVAEFQKMYPGAVETAEKEV